MRKEANEIMTKKLITISMSASMLEAYKIMFSRKIRHLPVVDSLGNIIGILSDRDVQRAMKLEHRQNAFQDESIDFDPADKTKDFMSFPIKTVNSTSSVRDVALMMLNEKISAFLVVDNNELPCGIVTTDDMLKLLISFLDKDPSRLRLTTTGVFSDFASDGHWASAVNQ